MNVEGVLERLQAKAISGDEERYRQLAAVQYYLQAMLLQCTFNWEETTIGITNYATLMDQIRELKAPVCLVTFNYDTLLEEALSLPTFGIAFRELSDYVASDYKVIKVHGSANWAHEVKSPIENVRGGNQLQVASQIINRRSKLVISGTFEMVYPSRDDLERGYPIGKLEERPMFPALAVPVENKPGDELPADHRKVLEECLPQVTKVLVIGWRAGESRFLETFAKGIGNNHPTFKIVSGSESSARKVEDKISKLLPKPHGRASTFEYSNGGFTEAVRNGETDDFIKSG